MSEFLASDLILPSTMTVPTKPALLMRAIWGHLAAVGVDRYIRPNAEEWRDFFLDQAQPAPLRVNFYYWIYPYRRQALLRDIASLDIGGHVTKESFYWLMKFYPLAFAVWMPETGSHALAHRDLTSYQTANANDVVDVLVDLSPVPHELTLEVPTKTQSLLIGRDAIVANSRTPHRRILRI